MKTKNKYLSYGTLLMITLLVLVQVADGFSGLLILPLSRFVYYGLTIGTEFAWINEFLVFGIMTIAFASILKITGLGYFGRLRLHLNPLGPNENSGSNILFMAGASNEVKSNTPKPVSVEDLTPRKSLTTEQGIVMISSGSVVFANKAFFKLTGYQLLDVFGRDFATLIQPDSLLHYTMLSRLSSENIRKSGGIRIATRNEKCIIASLAEGKESEFNQDGVNVFYLRESAVPQNAELLLNELFFETIENDETIHWIWDEKGVIYLNNSCRNNLPFSLGKVLSSPGLLLKVVKKSCRNKIRDAYQRFLLTGIFDEDICCLLESGEEVYYRVSISKQAAFSVYPIHYHAVAYDVTEQTLTLLKAEETARVAELANNNKTAFLANMSHEIRSPLNGIIGFSELLADKNLSDSERERYLNIIQNNGNALISLLSDLIDISKLESGKLIISNRKFVPARLMEELKFQFESLTYGKTEGVSMSFTKNQSFIDLEIESDPNRLRQILVNLITNAIKFTSKGRIEIGADFLNEEMLFWVKDSGIGIPYENQKAIFERFRQVEHHSTSPILGFGLGLAISKALVELLGGQLWVESIPDQGSLFVFTIKSNILNNTMETTQFNNNSSYPYDFREHTILIAEDIDFSFLYIEAVLRRTGVKILWAQNGKEAIEHVKTNADIDLVLMDMHMPVMNGYEATEIITQIRPGLPIIAQTAFVLPEDVKKCYAAGSSGYLAKPIRKEQLLNILVEYFDKMDQHAEGRQEYRANIG